MIALIFAAGTSDVWDLSTPRQLYRVNDEPLLHRTIRQLRQRAVVTVLVTSNKELSGVEADRFLIPPRDETLIDTILSTRLLWPATGTAMGLCGDVAWTNDALDGMCSCGESGDLRFYGRSGSSPVTGGAGGEIFGLAWSDKNALTLEAACVAERDNPRTGGLVYHCPTGGLHALYRRLCGITSDRWKTEPRVWKEIPADDATDDVDTPQAAKRLSRVWERRGIK